MLPAINLASFSALAARPGVTILDFTAAWCGPCRTVAPILEALATDYHVAIAAIDVDQEPLLAQQFSVRSMPTIVILRDGREVGRIVGSRSRSFIAGVLDRALAGDVAITSP